MLKEIFHFKWVELGSKNGLKFKDDGLWAYFSGGLIIPGAYYSNLMVPLNAQNFRPRVGVCLKDNYIHF